MTNRVKKIIAAVAIVAVLVGIPVVALAITARDVYRSPLYRDGDVPCTGADSSSPKGGQVILLPQPGEVEFKVKLRNAQPNTVYQLVVSEEPNCANPNVIDEKTTNANGSVDFYGSYNVSPGNHNLLFNLVAPNGTNNPINREIATANTEIVVPDNNLVLDTADEE
jgi:hypothetical protein